MKDLKTTELLDKVNEKGLTDELFEKVLDEIGSRIPFVDIDERIEELEKGIETREKEICELRRLISEHTHLVDGKSVKRI